MLSRLRTPESVTDNFTAWLRQMAYIVAAHAGLFVLIALVIGFPWAKRERAPVIVRAPGRRLRAPVRLLLRARAGAGGDVPGRFCSDGRGPSAASRRSSSSPAWP